MSEALLDMKAIDERLAIVRANLTESIEQAAAFSGAADEELYATRIADQDAELSRLLTRRDELIATRVA